MRPYKDPAGKTSCLDRRLLRQGVFDILLQSILTGELQPNERLRDEELTTWLGVSRTPVREALGTLAMIGLVETVPNQHTRVAPLDEKEVIEAIDVLCVLYPECLQQIDIQRSAARFAATEDPTHDATPPSPDEMLNRVLNLGTAMGTSVRNQPLIGAVRILQFKLIRMMRSDPTLLGQYADPSTFHQLLNTLVLRPECAEGILVRALRSVQEGLRSKLEGAAPAADTDQQTRCTPDASGPIGSKAMSSSTRRRQPTGRAQKLSI